MLKLGISLLALLTPLLGATAPAVSVVGPTRQTLQIEVWSFGFSPNPLRLHAVPVVLRFVNHSGSSHDFTAPSFFARAGPAPLPPEVELGPHETRSIALVPAPGTYHAHCSHFMHKQLGMSDLIIVEP
jgi:plastocyanin